MAAARRRALLLDYDGTLAPLTSDRAHAVPYPGIRAALTTIALARRRTTVWIVSGRTVADLARLVGLERLVDLWGSHGMERRSRHGRSTGVPAVPTADAFLDGVAVALERGGAGALVERKPYGLALHGRGADPGTWREASALLQELSAEAAGHGLALAEFDGGLELRPRGFHKGLVVESAFAEFGADAAVAYLGDDRTDEDAFAALRGRGLPVLVRSAARHTAAEEWLRPPAEVLEFLAGWTAACLAPS
ncbi:MAG: trehalose-phosphatase [Syntrophomonadaceae bacterium]